MVILDYLREVEPAIQALIGSTFTWFITMMGSGMVFFFKNINKKVLDSMLGFGAGVMMAASFWSLLSPAIELSKDLDMASWFVVGFGFLLGGLFLLIADRTIPHLHLQAPIEEQEGIITSWNRSILLVLAITLHNIPEGLALGVAFGAVANGIEGASLASAVALAIGIGLQNFPEGVAVSVPLRRDGFSRRKAFFYGQASGMVQPIASVIGALLVTTMQHILPFALSFAAGAMIYVAVEELIPESHINKNTDLATSFTMLGFTLLMVLDIALT